MILTHEKAAKNKRLRCKAAFGFFIFALALGAALQTVQVLLLPHLKEALTPINPDAWLRLTQVRQWLSGGSFFDHAVRNTNAPFGGIDIHWTRPLDMIISFFYFLTPASLAVNTRLMLVAAWLPAGLCLVAVLLMVRTVRDRFDHSHAVICAVLFTVFNSYRADYFTPGDSDHHGFLSTL